VCRNYNRWNWCIEYIDQFPKPPQYGDRVQMSRPSRQQSAYDRERYYGPPNGLTPKARILALEAIRERRPLDSEDASDSDEGTVAACQLGCWHALTYVLLCAICDLRLVRARVRDGPVGRLSRYRC